MMFNGRLLRPWPVRDPSSITIVRPIPGPTSIRLAVERRVPLSPRPHTRVHAPGNVDAWRRAGRLPQDEGQRSVEFRERQLLRHARRGHAHRAGFLPEEKTTPRRARLPSSANGSGESISARRRRSSARPSSSTTVPSRSSAWHKLGSSTSRHTFGGISGCHALLRAGIRGPGPEPENAGGPAWREQRRGWPPRARCLEGGRQG